MILTMLLSPLVTTVQMKRLSETELRGYLATGDWQGKAGGYGIQGPAGALIPWIQGSFTAVVGLPLSETPRVYLFPVGADVLRSPTSGDFRIREWQVIDQVLPVPFPIGSQDLDNANWLPLSDSLSDAFNEVRRYSQFRAYHFTDAFDDEPFFGGLTYHSQRRKRREASAEPTMEEIQQNAAEMLASAVEEMNMEGSDNS